MDFFVRESFSKRLKSVLRTVLSRPAALALLLSLALAIAFSTVFAVKPAAHTLTASAFWLGKI